MEVSSFPLPLLLDRVVYVIIFVGEEVSLTFVCRHLGEVGAHEEFPLKNCSVWSMSIITNLLTDLEQLDSYHSEQELEEQGHHHDVADSFDRDNQTLNNLLQAFRPVDGSEGSEHTENTENLQETDTAATEDGDE